MNRGQRAMPMSKQTVHYLIEPSVAKLSAWAEAGSRFGHLCVIERLLRCL